MPPLKRIHKGLYCLDPIKNEKIRLERNKMARRIRRRKYRRKYWKEKESEPMREKLRQEKIELGLDPDLSWERDTVIIS